MHTEFIERITALRRASERLQPNERAFVSQLYQRRNQIDDDDLSEKQRGWLKGIELRLAALECEQFELVEPAEFGSAEGRRAGEPIPNFEVRSFGEGCF